MTTIELSRRHAFPRLGLGIAAVFILALGIFFRFYNLDRKVFWEDEILGAIHTLGYTEAEIVASSPTVTAASDVQHYLQPNGSLGLITTIDSLAAEDPQHPPAYYLVSHLWSRFFGGSVEAMRTPAAIFGVLALPCVFWLALELFGSAATALIAVVLAAVSPFFVLYSQEAREYSLWTLAIALQGVVFLRAIRSQSTILWIAYSAITAASLYIYPLTGLMALGFTTYLLIRERGRLSRTVIACILADFVALALFIPWVKTMMTSAGVAQGMAKVFTSKLLPAEVVRIFARDIRLVFFDIGTAHLGPLSHSAMNAAFTLITVALCTFAIVHLVRKSPYAVWGFVVIGLCLSMMPLVLRDLLLHGNFVYQGRYFLPLLLGAQLAVAALFGRFLFDRTARSALRIAYSVLLIGILSGEVLSCAIASQATTWWNKDDERAPEVAAVVNDAHRPLVISNYFTPSILELSLYLNPDVPMRLNLRCAQCASSTHPGVAFETAGYQSVFVVRAKDAASDARYRWVDPQPFPQQRSQLNMFTVAKPAD